MPTVAVHSVVGVFMLLFGLARCGFTTALPLLPNSGDDGGHFLGLPTWNPASTGARGWTSTPTSYSHLAWHSREPCVAIWFFTCTALPSVRTHRAGSAPLPDIRLPVMYSPDSSCITTLNVVFCCRYIPAARLSTTSIHACNCGGLRARTSRCCHAVAEYSTCLRRATA